MIPLPPALAELVSGYDAEAHEGGESGGRIACYKRPGATSLFLKYGEGRVADDIADEALRLRWLNRRFPSPALRFFLCAEKAAWLLTDAVAGETGDALIEAGVADMATIACEAGQMLRRLHDLAIDDCPFDAGHALRMRAARRNVDLGLVDAEDFDVAHEGWDVERLWEKLDGLPHPCGAAVVTHGDYSLGNILFADGRATGLIDVGRLGRADPYQDMAIMWSNLGAHGGERGPDMQAAFLRAYGVEDGGDASRIAFHLCLDEFF